MVRKACCLNNGLVCRNNEQSNLRMGEGVSKVNEKEIQESDICICIVQHTFDDSGSLSGIVRPRGNGVCE